MEKLIELLYEYQKIKCFYPLYYDVEENKIYLDSDAKIWAEQYLISKEFWFIERLVDNKKIDLFRLSCTAVRYTEIIDADFSREDSIIMILAMQDDQINFLISYLK